MRLHLSIVLVAAVACHRASPLAPLHATLAITGARVFDGERVLADTDVLIDGATIVAVGPKLRLAPGVETVDGRGQTLLPGLIDAHTHTFDGSQLEQALAFGVTTELDMFAIPASIQALRATVPGRADLRSAGSVATAPGGHGTEYGFEIPTITEAAQAQAFVDARLAEGSDYLKIIYDGGAAYGVTIPTLTEPTLRALIAAAHARGKLAVVHIGTAAEARTALEAGADGLMHLFRDPWPGDDLGALAAGKRAFVVPTLTVLRSLQGGTSPILGDAALAPYLWPDSRETLAASFKLRVKATPDTTAAAIGQLRAAGVPVLVGTDASNPGTTHGASIHDELELLVAAGLSPTAVLAGATALPAAAFKLDDRGRIAVGKRADLLLVAGDPTTTITATRAITAIWHGGVAFDRAAYRARVEAATREASAAPTLGAISDFADGTPAVRFGQAWVVSTDAMFGGESTAELTVADQALVIEGDVVAGGRALWAGAMFSPGAHPFAPTDLSSKPHLAFRARGDGGDYVIMVFAKSRGRAPVVRPFTAGAAFAPVRFAWSDFDGLDGADVTAILIAATKPGHFRLVVDDVTLE